MVQGVTKVRVFWGLAVLLMGGVRADDPFEGLDARPPAPPPAAGKTGFFQENFTFKKELYAQFSQDSRADGLPYSRQSAGFEALKVFSTPTAKAASLYVQGRLVRRDRFVETPGDMDGAGREGWAFEVHNLYLDVYDVLGAGGRVNVRAGHFYLPFGLNLQTDTHGTLLQLSNGRNFGFERDWYAGFWGAATPDLNYDAYWLLGGGDDLAFRGQEGMAGARLSLAGHLRNELGLEGGLSFLGGERLDREALDRSPALAATSAAMEDPVVRTERAGMDARWTRLVPTGSVSLAAELSAGYDGPQRVFTELYQVEHLTVRRDWGLSAQYRRFWQDVDPGAMPGDRRADASVIGEIAYYLRNDIGGAYLHAIRLDVEGQVERQSGSGGSIITLQYYRYW